MLLLPQSASVNSNGNSGANSPLITPALQTMHPNGGSGDNARFGVLPPPTPHPPSSSPMDSVIETPPNNKSSPSTKQLVTLDVAADRV